MTGGTAPERGESSPPRQPLLAPRSVELLAPARDLACGRAAIDCGADAVYIGADRFGAREAAGNPLEDIAALVAYAHRYWARVYVALNTLLTDREVAAAESLTWQLHAVGADALIIQDVGLLECDLPPLPLIASTQMHNHTPGKVAFLARVGFQRAILARELCLDEIRAVRAAAPAIELECFVHGALCVSYSGRCALSYALGGRSANRGQCAQPCRKPYRLLDARGRLLAPRGHLLSLHDLNLADHLPALLDAGVTSFKIEGRLKELPYVANTVAHYRARLDAALGDRGLRRSASGDSSPGFTPDPAKTFNRGYTTFFLHGRGAAVGAPATPKMLGEEVGRVARIDATGVAVDTRLALHPGDGLCFFDARGDLQGTRINALHGQTLALQTAQALRPGMLLYRNHDHAFLATIQGARMERRIAVALTLRSGPGALSLVARDEDGVEISRQLSGALDPARKPDESLATIRRQLMKMGGSGYVCSAVAVEVAPVPFLAVSVLNGLRRSALDALTAAREAARPRGLGGSLRNDTPYPEPELDYLGNVLNGRAEAFYRRHGVTRIEPGVESGMDLRGKTVMTTRHCLKRQLGLCPEDGAAEPLAEPLRLLDDEGNRLRLDFDCGRCEMEIRLDSDPEGG
jgi:23S rRNA 5-hydroxycytidine C2501 synthase